MYVIGVSFPAHKSEKGGSKANHVHGTLFIISVLARTPGHGETSTRGGAGAA